MPTMNVCRLRPDKEVRISLEAEVLLVKLRPDEQVEIVYQLVGGTNSGSVILNRDAALRLLGVRWEEK